MPKVAIFCVTFNRLDTLTRTLESYERLTTPHEVLIVDNGTDDPKCLALLEELSKKYHIYQMSKLGSRGMNQFDENLSTALADYHGRSSTPWFAVSDCDCCFDISNPDTLDRFIDISETGKIVGPHLVADDIPPTYPLRTRVIRGENVNMSRQKMQWYRGVPYSGCPIDSTFHIFKRTPEFRRFHGEQVRVYRPYAVRHLDWYLDVFHPTEENLIYVNKLSGIGSYGSGWIQQYCRLLWEYGAERAFHGIKNKLNPNEAVKDHSLDHYVISWCYQYGYGCEKNESEAIKWMLMANPPGHPMEQYNNDAIEMVFRNNFTCMGW